MLHLFDTALERVVPLEPRDPGRLSIYLCGPTVSGAPHLGHGRSSLVWDVIRRYARWSGLDVRFVSNVTDIEDKIIAKAIEDKTSVEEVSDHYEKLWFATMERLGIEPPTETPHATAYVGGMVDLIGELIGRGHAYQADDGVYFDAGSIPGYGLLARQSIESLLPGGGGRVELEESGKRSPIDFVLWKLAKPGEPTWLSPWGAGRPGWHTECVVMSLDLLGEHFDLHGGGIDLAFPHHENERVQAVGIGRPFARHWTHSGLLVAESGEKMSKSVGNTLSLPELLDAYDPRAFRHRVLNAHYRSPMTASETTLAQSVAAVERLDTFAREFAGARSLSPDPEAVARFRARMDDDLDTPSAMAGAFDLLPRARQASGEEAGRLAAAAFEIFEQALGMPLQSELATIPPEAQAKAAARDEARRAKEWARADELRAELQTEGWIVEDGPSGTIIRR